VARVRVLFTGGGGAGTSSLWQQLSDRYEIHFADAQPLRIPPCVPDGHRHAVPRADADDFIDGLTALIARLRIDLLIPGVDEELLPVARARPSLLPCRVLLPEHDDVARCLDKLRFAEAAAAAGLRVPQTRRLDRADAGDHRATTQVASAIWASYPCIAKPRSGRGSQGVMIIRDVDALHGWQAVVPKAADVIVQELMAGPEFTVQVIADAAGQLRAIVPVRVHSKRGITVSAQTEANAAVIEACRRLHEVFPTAGVVNVQGILDAQERFWPFEVNPRISTTLCLVMAAGVDPLAIYSGSLPDGHAHADGLLPFTDGLPMERFWDTRIGTAASARGIEPGIGHEIEQGGDERA